MINHIKHATGALLFCLLLATAYTLEARACGYEEPETVQVVACTAC